jgi:hypothetical protein
MIALSSEGCLDTTQSFVSVLIPYLDLAVNKIYISQSNNLISLKAELLNMGNVPIHSFQIAGIIENGSVINEEWAGLLAPGASLLYEFTARYDINYKSAPGYYCIEATFPNEMEDQNPDNNNKCSAISGSFELFNPFPNPFDDEVSVSFNLPSEDYYELLIHDVTGKLVYETKQVPGLKGYNRVVIRTSNLSKGIYAFSLYFRDEVKVLKVMNY